MDMNSALLKHALRLLYMIRRDGSFIEARNALYRSGLIDRSGGSRRVPPRLSLSHQNQEAVAVLSIWESMNQGNSLEWHVLR